MPFNTMPSFHTKGCYKVDPYEIYCCKDHRDIVEDAVYHISVFALGDPLGRISTRFQYLIYFYLMNIVYLFALTVRKLTVKSVVYL